VFGKVFKGTLRDIVVAVKELKSKKIENIEQFQAEISIMAHLRHPNIVLFMGASYDPPFIVTEHLEGGDLHDIIERYEGARVQKNTAVPMNEVLRLAIGISRGMSWLHKSIPPIIHKDLKPKNIMLDSHGNPKIIDFGLSEEQQTKEIENRKISGSASWMSPEMLKGDNYTEKIDVFAFGIILWQLVAGSTVVYDTTKYEKLPTQQALQAFIDDITDNRMRPNMPQHLTTEEPNLVRLIEQCWEDDPNMRPSFSFIVKALVRIYLSNALKEEGSIKMWKQYFGTKVKGVSPMDFYSAIWNTLQQVDPPDATSPPAFYVKQKCLEAVSFTTSKTMDIERFGLILQWYGPLCSPNQNRSAFFDRIVSILKNKWFHGELSSQEAENILLAQNDKGRCDFLVRASLNTQYPFSMSRIEGAKAKRSFAHYRIAYNRSTGEYTMLFESKAGLKQEIRSDSLATFVKTARSTLGLKKPVPCISYKHIFIHLATKGESTYSVPTEKKSLF
jgi:serine/threonine protein kinase